MVEPDIERSQECEQQSDNRALYSDAAPQGQDFRLKPGMVHVQNIRRDDGSVVTTQPAQGCRARTDLMLFSFANYTNSHSFAKVNLTVPLDNTDNVDQCPV